MWPGPAGAALLRLVPRRRLLSTSAASSSESSVPPPLHGLRILDMTRVLAGPYASMILGDLGADVIKIEHPTRGDDTRQWGPPFVGTSNESAYFLCVNRNKRSVGVDFKRPEGRRILQALAKESDVLIENFLPGTLDRAGLGYEELKAINPRLIYCSISGFGSDGGPAATRPGYDVIIQGMYGLMSITGSEDGPPAKTGVALIDVATGLFAHGAILAALHSRHHTGVGQRVDCSLMDTQLACLVNIGQNWLLGATTQAKRWGTAHESIVPYQAFECKDGMYMVGAGNDKQFEKLAMAIGMPELSHDARFKTNRDRTQHRAALIPLLEAKFKTMTRQELGAALQSIGGGLPAGPLRDIGEAFDDEQARHRQMVVTVPHPTIGELPLAGIPVKYSHTKPSVRRPPPLLGQHTEEVLTSVLSYDAKEVRRLREAGVVA